MQQFFLILKNIIVNIFTLFSLKATMAITILILIIACVMLMVCNEHLRSQTDYILEEKEKLDKIFDYFWEREYGSLERNKNIHRINKMEILLKQADIAERRKFIKYYVDYMKGE